MTISLMPIRTVTKQDGEWRRVDTNLISEGISCHVKAANNWTLLKW